MKITIKRNGNVKLGRIKTAGYRGTVKAASRKPSSTYTNKDGKVINYYDKTPYVPVKVDHRKNAGFKGIERTISKNIYGSVIKPTDKRYAAAKVAVNTVQKLKPVPASSYTKLPWSNKKYFSGISVNEAAVIRYNGAKKTGKDLAYGDNITRAWKRDNLGRLYLSYKGPKSSQNKTVAVDIRAWIKPKGVR